MKHFFSIILFLLLIPLSQTWAETLNTDNALSQSSSAESSSLLLSDNNSKNKKHPLPVKEAFELKALSVDGETVAVSWLTKNNYYLYKDKISFVAEGARIESAIFPKAKLKEDEFFGEVSIYDEPLEVTLLLSDITSNPINLIIKHQGCWSGGVCYPPQSDTIKVDLTGSKIYSSTSSEKINTSELRVKEKFRQGGLALFFAAFIAGLALSWTPCVYPMVPILSGIIIGQKQTPSNLKAVLMSLAFVFSMSIAYGLIGATAGFFGAGINLQAIMQTPWVLVVFSLIFIFLAFSMFGFYDIQLPSKFQNKITNLSNKQSGGNFIGVSIMGFLSALIVGPCVTPFLATALSYVIAGGSALKGGISLFAMGLGMGVPLIIICGWGVNALPKAGPWMESVKQIFGFFMIAVALYLLDRILNPLVSLVIWAVLFTYAPIKIGIFKNLTQEINIWNILFKVLGLIIFAYGLLLWLLVAKGGGDIQKPLDSILYGETIEHSKIIKFNTIKNEDQLSSEITKTVNNNKLLIVKFYADWCISCNKLERVVFSNKAVNEALKDTLTSTLDVTDNNRFNQSMLARFSLVGPPALLFFKNGLEQRSYRIIGEISAKELVEHLNNLR
ncbi:MAG: protein-disulfide reductase DsbD [Candidatus Thioglobus sp.]|jgi:thiol:disulfide interchange protein DsbD|nr:protein-disulfide reductase DsbD [Candidatus Thioglobus sp.]